MLRSRGESLQVQVGLSSLARGRINRCTYQQFRDDEYNLVLLPSDACRCKYNSLTMTVTVPTSETYHPKTQDALRAQIHFLDVREGAFSCSHCVWSQGRALHKSLWRALRLPHIRDGSVHHGTGSH